MLIFKLKKLNQSSVEIVKEISKITPEYHLPRAVISSKDMGLIGNDKFLNNAKYYFIITY